MREMPTVVDTGWFDVAPGHTSFMDVELRAVKTSEIVDHGHHKLQRVIGFEKQALERFHGKTRRVGLAKGIATEAFYLSPYLFGQFGIVASLPGVAEKLGLQIAKRVRRFFLSRHNAPQDVGFVQIQTGK